LKIFCSDGDLEIPAVQLAILRILIDGEITERRVVCDFIINRSMVYSHAYHGVGRDVFNTLTLEIHLTPIAQALLILFRGSPSLHLRLCTESRYRCEQIGI
jgi:hypothetical protein